jgi:hypothetical protein
MKFTDSTEQDIQQLSEWIQQDPYHRDCLNPRWWLTGQGLQSFCLQDSIGPTMYIRLDDEKPLLRIHIQFGPESEVSKSRVVKSIVKALPVVQQFATQNKFDGFIFKSISEPLINFLKIKFGFTPTGTDNDYWMPFEVKDVRT